MYAKYIKREIPDLNGTGRTQAYYKMELTPKSYEEFVNQCAREGHMEESHILAVMSLVSEKLARREERHAARRFRTWRAKP